MKSKKTAQMEILGLAIVIVLILVAVIFVVRLGFEKPSKIRPSFINSQIASNMLNTFLRTSARDDCFQLTMTELLQDCAQGIGIQCDNGDDSCKYANSTAKEIFEKTFDKWNMDYEFLAYTYIKMPLIRLGETCKSDKKSELFPIPIRSRTMYVKMDICG